MPIYVYTPPGGAPDVITSADRGAVNGVAALDSTGRLVANQIPTNLTVAGNVTCANEVVVRSISVLETLRNSAAMAFPRSSISPGTSNGTGDTFMVLDDYMAGNVFTSASSFDIVFGGNPAHRAFDKNFSGSFWMMNSQAPGYTNGSGSGPFLPTSNVYTTVGAANVRGEYIQIQFPTPIIPTAYQMVPRINYFNRTPVRWRLAACTANVAEVNLAANATVQAATVWTEIHVGNVQSQAIAAGVSWPLGGRRFNVGNVATTFNTFRLVSEATANSDGSVATIGELTIFGFPVPTYA